MSTALLRPALLAAAIALALPAAAPAATRGESPIAWQPAAGDADIERAFAQSRSEHKPLLLYWGAKWCPPCNQLKATLFNRQDFIERSRAFVAVQVDGDLPGAQKLGTRFKVRGYPTMILFNTEGQEITRLPGEVDAPQVMSVLQLGLANGRPVRAVLADARAGKALPPNEWRLLAFYSWDTDEEQLLPKSERPSLLGKLAAACPADAADAATRLQLKALAERADDAKALPDAGLRDKLRGVLADPAASRAQMDVLTNQATDLVKAAAGADAAERDRLVQSFDQALQRLQADETLSRADRSTALLQRIELKRLQLGVDEKSLAKPAVLPAALLQAARERAGRDDREITDGYERQAVITTDAYTLQRAGLLGDADALLQANLSRSHSPYYLMSELADNAKIRGDKAGALRWSREAFEKSEGPATRLQWGASYVSTLVELSPQDGTRIEQTVQQLWREAAAQPNAFYERSARSLQKVAKKLDEWNAGGRHAAALQRLRTGLDAVCGKLDAADPQRATCDALLKPAGKKTA